MKYCDKCQVKIIGNRHICPLCQGSVTALDDDDHEIFPHIPTIYQQYNILFRGLIFASIVIGVIAIVLNILLPAGHYDRWAFFVLAGIGCFWLVLVVAVRKRSNIKKNMLYQTMLLAALMLLWDYLTGWRGWSLDFAIPILFFVSLTTMIILTKVLRQYISDDLVYLCLNILISFIPVIFLLIGRLHVRWPSIICVANAVIALAAILLFMDKSLKRELKRRLHI